MKKIEAFEATDGTPFFTEAECIDYEEKSSVDNWDKLAGYIRAAYPNIHHWRQAVADDIRGFLPPVAAKPELDMKESKLTFNGVEFTAPYGDVMVSYGEVLCQIRALSAFVDVANMQPSTVDEVQAIQRALDTLETMLMSDADIKGEQSLAGELK